VISNAFLLVLGIFLTILFFFIVVYIKDIKYGLIFWLFSAVFITPEVFAISLPGVPDVYLERIIFVLLFFILFVKVAIGQEETLPWTSVELFWMILLSVLLVSMMRTGFFAAFQYEEHPSRVFLAGFFFPFAFYFFGKTIFYSEERLKTLLWASFFFYLYFVITAYMEHFELRQFIIPRYISDPLKGIHFGRARGPFLNAAVNGWVMVTLFALVVFLRSQVESPIARIMVNFGLLLSPLAVFYTYTRAAWLAYLLASLMFIFLSKRLLFNRLFIFVPIILLVILGVVNWERLQSKERATGGVMQTEEVEDRIKLFKITTAVFKENPIFGIGFGRFRRAAILYGPEVAPGASLGTPSQHNIFFSIVSEVGLLGLISFSLILISAFRRGFPLFRHLGEEGLINRDLIITFWVIMITYLVSASFIQTQYFLLANVLSFLWVGIIMGLYQRIIIGEQPIVA